MSEPTTERETCACGDPTCRASAVQVYKSVERLACYERTIANLRAAIALVAKHELLEEMRLGMNEHMKGKGLYVDPGEALAVAYDAAVAKYTAAEPAVETREG